jgi:hypothetical protein
VRGDYAERPRGGDDFSQYLAARFCQFRVLRNQSNVHLFAQTPSSGKYQSPKKQAYRKPLFSKVLSGKSSIAWAHAIGFENKKNGDLSQDPGTVSRANCKSTRTSSKFRQTWLSGKGRTIGENIQNLGISRNRRMEPKMPSRADRCRPKPYEIIHP